MCIGMAFAIWLNGKWSGLVLERGACVTCGAKCSEPLHSLWEDADVRLQGLKCFNFIQSKNITTRVLLSSH